MLTGAKLQQKFQNIVIICHKNITFMFKKTINPRRRMAFY